MKTRGSSRHSYLAYLTLLLAIPGLYLTLDELIEDSPPAGHIYVLEGKAFTHVTQEGVDAHGKALWDVYCRQHEELMKTRPRSLDKGIGAYLKPNELKSLLDEISKSILMTSVEDLVGASGSKQTAYLQAYVSCLRAKLINDGLEFIKDIKAANPAHLGADPSGYYNDRNGGALCLVATDGGYNVYVGAGRGPNLNSDRLFFKGAVKHGVIVAEPIPDEPDRRPSLMLDHGMVWLSNAGDRLDATYVRVGSLTEAGKALASSVPLGSQITDDAGGELYEKFIKTGVVFFRELPPEWPTPYVEAMAIAGIKPEEDSGR